MSEVTLLGHANVPIHANAPLHANAPIHANVPSEANLLNESTLPSEATLPSLFQQALCTNPVGPPEAEESAEGSH